MNKENILGNPQHYGVWVGGIFLNVTFNDNPPLSIDSNYRFCKLIDVYYILLVQNISSLLFG